MEGRHCLAAATVVSGLAGEVPSEAAAQESKYYLLTIIKCMSQQGLLYNSELVFTIWFKVRFKDHSWLSLSSKQTN